MQKIKYISGRGSAGGDRQKIAEVYYDLEK